MSPVNGVNPLVRKALDDIQATLLALPEYQRGQVIDVLTALRGPDKDSDEIELLKAETTARIRRAAFPNMAPTSDALEELPRVDTGQASRRWSALHFDAFPFYHYTEAQSIGGSHFAQHARAAFDALGITFNTTFPNPNNL